MAADNEDKYCLRTTATYTDNIDSDLDATTMDVVDLEEMAHGTHDAPVQIADPANAAPKLTRTTRIRNTLGDQADAMRIEC